MIAPALRLAQFTVATFKVAKIAHTEDFRATPCALQMLSRRAHLPAGAAAFATVSENAVEEAAVSEDVLCPHDDASMVREAEGETRLCDVSGGL